VLAVDRLTVAGSSPVDGSSRTAVEASGPAVDFVVAALARSLDPRPPSDQ